ncbi:MAG: transposase [Bacteroidota bacterium]
MESLQIDSLLSFTKSCFDGFADKRTANLQYKMGDIVQSALALFSLKDSSLLAFNNRFAEREDNLLRIYKITNCPSDTQMRQVLDQIKPIQIERVHHQLIRRIEQAGALGEYEFFPGWKLVLLDGVEHFHSHKIHCDHCRTRHHKDGRVSYNHAMVVSVLAHPDKKEVLPICVEAITNQDGQRKNDCELVAVQRLLHKLQTRYVDQGFIYVADALYANGPFIESVLDRRQRFLIRVKRGSGAGYVVKCYEQLAAGVSLEDVRKAYQNRKQFKSQGISRPQSAGPMLEEHWSSDDKYLYRWHYVNGLILNEEHPRLRVNYLRYEQYEAESGELNKRFEWVTNIKLTAYNVEKIGRAGRCRWQIENEAFNTLKNQDYHFEHNYGHGKKYLCTNFAQLMMMAFLLDQLQQHVNELFQQTLSKRGAKKYLWEDIRSFFRTLPFSSMEMIYKAILYGVKVEYLVIDPDSS